MLLRMPTSIQIAAAAANQPDHQQSPCARNPLQCGIAQSFDVGSLVDIEASRVTTWLLCDGLQTRGCRHAGEAASHTAWFVPQALLPPRALSCQRPTPTGWTMLSAAAGPTPPRRTPRSSPSGSPRTAAS